MKSTVIAAALIMCAVARGASAVIPELAETREIQFTGVAAEVANTAETLGSAVRIYEYLVNEFEYLPYYGARSGAHGTLWRKAGNDVDLAALLVSMLRSQSIPARYATGKVTVTRAAFASWLSVSTPEEALLIFENSVFPVCTTPPAGATPCIDLSNSASASFPHVWVEALLRISNYRGIAISATSAPCTTESADCKWIALDPSFKAHQITPPTADGLSVAQTFDYARYYNAIKTTPDDPWRNRNPADILQDEVLRAHPGVGVDDALGTSTIVPVTAGILPGSLPYDVDPTTVSRYVSAAQHDGLSPYDNVNDCPTGAFAWTHCLTMTVLKENTLDFTQTILGERRVPLDRLARNRMVIRVTGQSPCAENVLSCDHFAVENPVLNIQFDGELQSNERYVATLTTSASLAPFQSFPLRSDNSYVLVAGGSEASAGQVAYATAALLTKYKGARILPSTGSGYYADVNANGTFENPPDLTVATEDVSELLHIAARLFPYRHRLRADQVRRLTRSRKEAGYVLGLASAESLGTYVDGAPVSLVPSGLLIDVSVSSRVAFRLDANAVPPDANAVSEVDKLLEHVVSSLEHEVWQDLTGFDAVSTVRGIQKALKQDAELLTVQSAANLNDLYAATGFASSPSSFTRTVYPLFANGQPTVWESSSQRFFEMFKKVITTATASGRREVLLYDDAGALTFPITTQKAQEFFDTGTTPPTPYDRFLSWPEVVKCLWFFKVTDTDPGIGADSDILLRSPLCLVRRFHGTRANMRTSLTRQWNYVKELFPVLSSLDAGQGFNHSDYIYREGLPTADEISAGLLQLIRDDVCLPPTEASRCAAGSGESLVGTTWQLPNKRVTDPPECTVGSLENPCRANYEVFYLLKNYGPQGGELRRCSILSIQHNDEFVAGGGFVIGEEGVVDWDPSWEGVVGFDNSYHNNQVLHPDSNNSVQSSWAGDPVSTATGNMFHDEVDFVIPARPFDLAFTRTYNSRPSRLIQEFTNQGEDRWYWPLGPGWTHSYGMLLISNDFCDAPNSGAAGDGDGIVSSITFVDERGGEVNFPRSGCATGDPVSPPGFFGALKDPWTPYPAIEFPDGRRYLFRKVRDLSLTSGVAVLEAIEDASGPPSAPRRLTIDYGNGTLDRMQTVRDALGRTVTMQHQRGRLVSVTDWTGRTWTYGYDGAGDPQRLVSVTNPLGYATTYAYEVGPEFLYTSGGAATAGGVHYRLTNIVYPFRSMGSLQRSMTFDYFTNGWAAGTTDALGNTERFEYDLFRRQTSVTDPRGFTRMHANDERGGLQSLVQADGNVLQFKSSDTDNLRYEKMDAYGRATRYSYAADESIGTAADRAGQVTLERDRSGAESHYEYTLRGTESGRSLHMLTRTRDKNGHPRVIEYCDVSDGSGCVKGRQSRTKLASGAVLEERRYFSDGSPPDGTLRTVSERIDLGNSNRARVTEFSYDNAGSRLRPDGKTVSGTTSTGTPSMPCQTAVLEIAANADDAEGSRGQCISWPPTCPPTFFLNSGANLAAGQDRPGGYSSWQTMLRFETGNLLPDTAEVISAELEFHVIGRANTDGRSLLVSWAGGDGAWSTSDFTPTGSGNAAVVPLASFPPGKLATVALTASQANIDRIGYTGLKLNVGNLPDAPPSGANSIQIAAREHPTLPLPRLRLTYCGAPGAAQPAVAQQWEYEYDPLKRLTSESLKLSPSSTTHPPGILRVKTTYEYDKLDRVVSGTRPDGSTICTDHDEDGNPWRVRGVYSSNGLPIPNACSGTLGSRRNLATRTYDAAGRKLSEIDTEGNQTRWTYDTMGHVLSVTDANNHTTTYEYDSMGRRTRTIDPNGHETLTQYDANGGVRSITTAAGTTLFQRDAMGRVTQTISPMLNRTVQRYDANGNLIGVLDANVTGLIRDGNDFGESLTTEYDEFNRVTKLIDAANGETRFEYDLLGNRTAVIDALNRRTTFGYNDLGQLVWILDPLGKATTMTYDEAGQLATRTDRNGRRTSYTYDFANRLIGIDFASTGTGLDEEQHYDAFGNMDWVRNANVTYYFTYDSLNRLTSKTDSRTGKSIHREYDKVGNIVRRTGYEGDVTTFTYDSANRLVAMSNPDYLSATYHYDGAGRLLNRTFSNGARTDFSYDTDSRLTEVQQHSASGGPIVKEKFCLDAVGNITAIVRGTSGGTCAALGSDWTQYAYDDLYRLTAENQSLPGGGSSSKTSLTYDRVGNIVTAYGDTDSVLPAAYFHNAGNRLTSSTAGGTNGGPVEFQYDYDDEGNRTVKRDGSGTAIEWYSYDDKNRMIAFQRGTEVTTYAYDPFDQRIAVHPSGGEKQVYHLDGEHIEAIYDARGKPQATFLRGAVIDEMVGAYYYDAQGRKTFFAYTHDRLTSVASLVDHAGATAQTYTYSPFGADRAGTGSTTPNRLKYTGREQDASGLYYYRARYYDPAARRFLTQDPLGFDAGTNFYAYVQNNPLVANDPNGKILALPLFSGAVGAGVGALGSVAAQVYTNRGFSNFNLANVGVAAGVGFVAGAAAPYTALTWTGAVATGAIANGAQYGITQFVNGDNITIGGSAVSFATGAVGGAIAGPLSRSAGLRFDETSIWIDPTVAAAANAYADIAANTGLSTFARNAAGALTSNLDFSAAWGSTTPILQSETVQESAYWK